LYLFNFWGVSIIPKIAFRSSILKIILAKMDFAQRKYIKRSYRDKVGNEIRGFKGKTWLGFRQRC